MTAIAEVAADAGTESAVAVDDLHYAYGERRALDGVSLRIARGEIFGVLGPNGGGKTTLFAVLSTLRAAHRGSVRIFGLALPSQRAAVRGRLGVVFQHPSLDAKLTVGENLRHFGHLHGLRGAELKERSGRMLTRLGVADRAGEIVERLSGGLQRRVELAKGLLTNPELLLLDEPSTGLDPGARRDLWQYLQGLRRETGTTIVVTTHLMDEAEQCDRLAIMDAGRIVSTGAPTDLKRALGGDVVTVRCSDPDELAARLLSELQIESAVIDDSVRFERPDASATVGRLYETFGPLIEELTVAKPTLDDVFVKETGHRFWGSDE